MDREKIPLASRARGVVIGTLVMGFVGAAFVSPRTIPFGLPIVALCCLVAGAERIGLVIAKRWSAYGLIGVIGFVALTLASAIWARDWDAPLGPAIKSAAYFLMAVVVAQTIRTEKRSNAFHIAEGLWLGMFAGLAYLLVEILSDQAIKLALYRALGLTPSDLQPQPFFFWDGAYLMAISPFDLTRNIAPATMYLWAALLAIRSGMPDARARIASVALFSLAAAVVALSEHETSKLGMIVSTAVFAMAKLKPAWSLQVIRVTWVAACLAIIPISLALHRADVQHATWLQESARHRVVIWNYTAEEALKSPIFGVGAGMMYRIGSAPQQLDPGEEYPANVPHAHNVYLQTWFELGAVGASLLALIGLSVLEGIGRLSRRTGPYAQATFAAAMVMAGGSYGMWQPWFIAMFAFCVSAFAIAMRIGRPDAAAPGLPPPNR